MPAPLLEGSKRRKQVKLLRLRQAQGHLAGARWAANRVIIPLVALLFGGIVLIVALVAVVTWMGR